MERRRRGDKRGKKGVKERGKKALTDLVWGQENDFYFSGTKGRWWKGGEGEMKKGRRE